MSDLVNYNPDVLSCLANLSNDEVFTPPEIARQVIDCLPQNIFEDKNTTFLDPGCKSGVFLREIAKKLMKGLEKQIPDMQERINHIFTKQLYALPITELTSLLSRRSIYCSKTANGKYSVAEDFDNEQGNILFNKTNHKWVNGRCTFCGASENVNSRDESLESHAYHFIHTKKPEDIFNMKFDVIISNPPYQLSDGGDAAENARTRGGAIPIYHKFVEQAKKMNPRYLSMIIPSRYFTGGRGLDKFRNEMLTDTRIRTIYDFIDASECFPGVDIKGGVHYFLWERDYKGDCTIHTHANNKVTSVSTRPLLEEGAGVFIRFNEAISIFRKIRKYNERSFNIIISSAKPFGLRTFFKGKDNPFPDAVKIYQNRGIGYINRNDVLENKQWIDKYKILVPYAVGSGDSKTDLIKPIYAEPGTCCTETYLVIGATNNSKEAMNIISYIQTKFFHFTLTLKKNTQHATKGAYEFVPIQNFDESWTDEKLYKKYNLTNDEIDYIETMIRPMEINK
jgi:hypothetical protein